MTDASGLLEPALVERLLERSLAHGGDLAEVYAERRSGFSLALDDRGLERARNGRECGASVRVVAGEATYFGHVDGLAESDLERVADSVASAVRGRSGRSRALRALERPEGQSIERRPEEVAAAHKAELLRECDDRARALEGRVAQVNAGYDESRQRIQVANSDGLHVADDRTRVRLGIQV
ncbi:hypothetical protein LCGC14_2820400, partial [marine sediment metagenome]